MRGLLIYLYSLLFMYNNSIRRSGSSTASGSVLENQKTEEIPMDANHAYETIDVRYDVGKGREAREQDEAIYEIPSV